MLVESDIFVSTLSKMPSDFELKKLMSELGIKPDKAKQMELASHLKACGYTKHQKRLQGLRANYWSKSQ